ncbi:MAG: efflux RND transporter periplasmic adaptor subunit, partial [Deferrisomatales bacterium]
TLRLEAAGRVHEWPGRVVRALGEVDDRGRMARVVVEVSDPFGLETGRRGPELVPGLFVEAAFRGDEVEAVTIPRSALREGAQVWVLGPDSRLQVRTVKVARRERHEVLVTQGLEPGDRVVLTPLSGAVAGMELRVAEPTPTP